MNSRIIEHRNHINWNTNSQLVVTNHRVKLNNDFDWENVQILDHEKSLNKRLKKRTFSCKKMD